MTDRVAQPNTSTDYEGLVDRLDEASKGLMAATRGLQNHDRPNVVTVRDFDRIDLLLREAAQAITDLIRERNELREAKERIHRRAQKAESALPDSLSGPRE